ncbi:wolf-Hirschhorn syndrome candidate 1 [Culex quinquefasciatus]|uniref:Wolf-Hirschhorn syndrome candidate 1 n=1 Tax=Culex quinquefasciatus TaxID=7176 RepID=B0X128_CULQU|nr:wolf-Hirschhorn syndrome candidate 1 [Culex quinquefasciatus]|eukprot:XP_001863350.1 wolf-Hirschhorn syndrome candidate 1 [Culex quinquefasciatus]
MCHSCVTEDPCTNSTATRGSLVRCIRCPSKCIPAGFQLPTTSIMICPKHSLDQCSINVKAEVSYAAKPARRPPTSSASSLTRRKVTKSAKSANPAECQFLARAHDSPASGPGRGVPAATQVKRHLRALLRHARFWMDQPEANLPLSRRRLGHRGGRKQSDMMERYNEESTQDDLSQQDSNCINRALLVDTHQALGSGCASRDRVREVINNEELPRRIEQKDENYYFLTVDSELTIDAGPKSNLARFINYSCESNCETLLWKVGGSQSVGLFALKDLKALTFNYNFETFGDQKKICHCGASKCCGLIVSEGTEN